MGEQIIPVLRVADAAVAVAWYERLGFTKHWEHRFDPTCPAFVSIARGQARLFLSEHKGDARPDTLVHLVVEDTGPVVAEFGRPTGEPPPDATSSFATRMATGCGSARRQANPYARSAA